jgi:hypothetical protein
MSSLAVVSLFLGILGWAAVPFFSAIAAVVLGHMARIQIAKSEGKLTGDGLAVIGLWLGYANIALVALAVVCLAVLFLIPAVSNLLAQ